MNTTLCQPETGRQLSSESLQVTINENIDEMITSLPDPQSLNGQQQREIISRYTAVLEGNFIYWMTAAYLSAKSQAARPILLDNLHEEIRDCHPAMLRRFAIAADAFPTAADALAVHEDLTSVRLFLGKLSGVRTILMMAFFEGFIQRFMIYLADLAGRQGSTEQEYTVVHGVCDITHTQELFNALASEMVASPAEAETDLFEGVRLLRTLIETIVWNKDVAPRPGHL